MADFVDLVQCMRKTAVESIEANKPVSVHFGTVTSITPLVITVEQKLIIEAPQLILTRNVTEHQIEMTIWHETENETDHIHEYFDSDTGMGASGSRNRVTSPTTHKHAYEGRKVFTVHKGLLVGERVILLRVQGGQRYVVLDRVG